MSTNHGLAFGNWQDERRQLVGIAVCPIKPRDLAHGAQLCLLERFGGGLVVDVERSPIGHHAQPIYVDVADRPVRRVHRSELSSQTFTSKRPPRDAGSCAFFMS